MSKCGKIVKFGEQGQRGSLYYSTVLLTVNSITDLF